VNFVCLSVCLSPWKLLAVLVNSGYSRGMQLIIHFFLTYRSYYRRALMLKTTESVAVDKFGIVLIDLSLSNIL
jgi:hypothetical protein